MKRIVDIGVAVCALAALSWGQAAPGAKEIVARSVAKDQSNFQRAKDYTYVQRVETKKLDGKGKVKEVESETFDVVMIDARPYSKLVRKDGRELEAKEARKVQEKFDEEIRKRSSMSAEQKRKEAEKEKKRREESRAFAKEIPEAFDFELLREDKVSGMAVWVIRAEPKAGYQPKVKDAGLLKKFRGTMWIDQAEYQWVKLEAEVIDTVSFGWVLARLNKGTRLTFEQSRVNSEVWLPFRATSKIDARLALLKAYRAEVDVRWEEYRKFSTESNLVEGSAVEAEAGAVRKQ